MPNARISWLASFDRPEYLALDDQEDLVLSASFPHFRLQETHFSDAASLVPVLPDLLGLCL
jgi:hypothetical protein